MPRYLRMSTCLSTLYLPLTLQLLEMPKGTAYKCNCVSSNQQIINMTTQKQHRIRELLPTKLCNQHMDLGYASITVTVLVSKPRNSENSFGT